MAHPEIRKFMSLCNPLRNDAPLSLQQMQTRPFLAFWPSMIVNRWDSDANDFLTTFWGTRLVEACGLEQTGQHVRSAGGETGEILHHSHAEVIKTGEPLYLGGQLDWFNKSHRRWDQVTLPLTRENPAEKDLSATISFLVFAG